MKRIVLLSFIFALNVNAMEVKSSSWLDTLEKVILGDAPVSSLFYSRPSRAESFELTNFNELPLKKSPFTALPQEIQNIIIMYVREVLDSSDIIISAKAINSLAQVNKELNQKINSPEFTQKLLTNFYEKFAGSSYIMPHRFKYQHLIVKKGSRMNIPKNNADVGYVLVAILLRTQGAIKWLEGYEAFMEWVDEAKREYDQYWSDMDSLRPYT